MAADVQTGMSKGDMKKLLVKSKTEPVFAAMAAAPEPGWGLLLLHKSKQGMPLLKDLQTEFKDAKTPAFGVAYVDLEDDPKLVKFRINKSVSGMAKRLVKTLRGTGFSKVVIVMDDENETPVDKAVGEEEGDAADAPGTPAPATAAAPPPPPPPPPPTHDAASLTRLLTALAGSITQAAGTDAGRRTALLKLATDADAAIKGGNLAAAEAAIKQLNGGLTGAAAPGTAAQTAAGAPAAPGDSLGKSQQIWQVTHDHMKADLDKLGAAIRATYPDQASELAAAYQQRTAGLLQTLDLSLVEALKTAGTATEPAQRSQLVQQAQVIVQRYQAFVASEPLLTDLDDNPFLPLAIRQTMTTTLTALASAIH